MLEESDNEEILEDEDLSYRARTTNVQVQAIGHLLREEDFYEPLSNHVRLQPFKLGANNEIAKTERWLLNGWNTERLLRFQLSMPQEAKQFAVQWAFPQAYYACYCHVLALFSVTGLTETSHMAAIRKFGNLAKEGKLPEQIGPYADGPMYEITLHGVKKNQYPSPLYLELEEPASVKNQIAQLLCATREKALKGKKTSMLKDFKTKRGKPKQKLTPSDWKKVSEKLGPTTILGYLYRKRIKANYQEIDSLLHNEINGDIILEGLVSVVNAFAAVCEGHIMRVLPAAEKTRLRKNNFAKEDFIKNRAKFVWNIA